MERQCSFCGRDETFNLPVIEGAEANICRECAEICFDELQTLSFKPSTSMLKPHEIKAELDKFIVGQDEAKRLLSVAIYNHYKRIEYKSKVDIQKSNILVIGPTGSGKTYLIQTLAKLLDVPFVIGDATTLTQAGYVGEDVESLLEKLVIKAGGDIKKAEKGIIYIDEIDKIASYHTDGGKKGKDVGGQAVQESLLKIIEDSEVHLNMGSNPLSKQRVTIQTQNILFIFGGAFVGLENVIKERLKGATKTLGFLSSPPTINENNSEVSTQDFINFGLIPEFVGRISIIAMFKPLTKEDLIDILVKPKNAILKQYKELFRMDGVKLRFKKNAIEFIAEEAMKKNIGARGLKGFLEQKMFNLMFELPQREGVKSCTITKEILLGNEPLAVEH
ncbi:ATP-dependent Clp protease ATP-binding subunit ClpX (plasmid) [Paenibacillus thiaminolyticus]|uniref:ATP-dependent Clp protease ATP-binding subunit ClpX n=1 Tax=Paenibacillus thiaminolyticus TaxID=49283 RepID=UPI00232F81DC|nr:ATP-dependent Clp protease ATP-binding subunit ClpX [Paenibacillus thiaminolyticus]WCF11726.1 ATP-dependent Clp protease ATP-binding subunit ClpX [Paenibacillus thiaminolyticus]